MTRPFLHASRLGFGCASLGSRIGPRPGSRALNEAFEAGVNWFDVAPSYGDGQAESLLGAFAQTRRDKVHICTKCGVAPPPVSSLKAALRPVSRLLVKGAPVLRSLAGRARGPAEPQALSRETIIGSLERSLVALKTDYVDVLALHDPQEEDITKEEVARALEDAVTSGKARTTGVAGSPQASIAAVRAGLPVAHLQFAAAGLPSVRAALGPAADFLLVTHSVVGRGGAAEGDGRLRAALEENSDGIVIVSMFGDLHRRRNIATLASVQT